MHGKILMENICINLALIYKTNVFPAAKYFPCENGYMIFFTISKIF